VLSSEIAEIKESRDKMRRSYKKLIDQMQRTPLGRKLAEARETVKDDSCGYVARNARCHGWLAHQCLWGLNFSVED
jgi:hypothetical protein